MADERNVESFTLGIIVVLLAYFLLEKKLGRGHSATSNGGGGKNGCGCNGGGAASDQNDGAPAASPIALGLNPLSRSNGFPPGQGTAFFPAISED